MVAQNTLREVPPCSEIILVKHVAYQNEKWLRLFIVFSLIRLSSSHFIALF